MGKLVVIEGLDGSGKATQTAILAQALKEKHRLQVVTFPNYESEASALVRMYLGGQFGTKPEDVNPYAASSFYAVDRFASYKMGWQQFYLGGGLVLADRYTTSNAIHQCAKLPPEEWQAFANWLQDFEYDKMGIPKPDLVVYLEVEPQTSQNLLMHRYKNKDKRDIHEQNLDYLLQCQKAAQWCAGHFGWHSLQCTENGKIKPRQAIAKEVLGLVCTYLEDV